MLGHAGGDFLAVFCKARFSLYCAAIAVGVIFFGAHKGLIEVADEAGAQAAAIWRFKPEHVGHVFTPVLIGLAIAGDAHAMRRAQNCGEI